MKASELRIGNLVKSKAFGDDILTVNLISTQFGNTGVCFVEKHFVGCLFDDLKAIPLTEEWLLKFGWVWNLESKSFENGDPRMHLVYRELNGSYTMYNYVLNAIIIKRIFYVHQLQNLYFALTGEELKLI